MSPIAIKDSFDRKAEVAMAIAEQVATLSFSRRPISIDSPLMLASLDPATVVQLNSWLQARFDWQDEKRLLFDEEITAESLAQDVVDRGRDKRNALQASRLLNSPPTPSIIVTPEPSGRRARSSSRSTVTSDYLTGEITLDIGMAPYESWTGHRNKGRKASVLCSLLGLGLLGSPGSSSFSLGSPGGMGALFNTIGLSPSQFDPRAPSMIHTPLFSPWLETVRFPALEAVQSPWVPNLPRTGSDGLLAFPQSPRGCC
ncbi:uncharacterized protein FIBRA_05607 [Fibroporia radiculosa]|uniref:Uncharacterized protein n=1 Tax=Fibroporia radiculosa TaxID=599839 RepID=J4H3L9_9APHY|nr:uncharacterized protein FIBRA_05607 [Fibroporia radiculosa]CCM03474.1 predicted protein [Fibroporia radiculosa]